MPAKLAPQLATLVDAAPAGDEWLNEIKFDGYRMLARISGGSARFISRNGNDWTAKFAATRPRQAASDGRSGSIAAFAPT
jgi:bifunctional non-homologous end joining protein LigD